MSTPSPAGFWIRLVASIVDSIAVGAVLALLSAAIYGEFVLDEYTPLDLLNLLYFLILPVVWYGYTLGKRAMGIRIARLDGEKVTIGTMLLRQLVAGIVYALTLGLAALVSAIMVGVREDKRSMHDFMANTYVTYEKPDALKQDSQSNEQEELA
ncbi:RDD family protein [Alkalibacillus salilacus]|uniref:RDD family membrane protein YckC n=1 Tax=Alkalibacillus salilacus TaxID=284582 RepID=A0ABT9VEP3_9BACI|nr:RDD family protein [Alkalibacillus salilacus]MDQ0159377.1 putative RDD family membrane protein YckC [Alkalibacillus salilacus]